MLFYWDSFKLFTECVTVRLHCVAAVAAVTGSNGKTTVTQMVAHILREGFGVDGSLATKGNLNNHLGVPLTLMQLRPQHKAGVVELGMNHPGEIRELAQMAQPTIALVNNAQREHQEFMESVRAVALENGAVLQALPTEGIAVIPSPATDQFSQLWRYMSSPRRVLTFGMDKDADVQATATWKNNHWEMEMQTPVGRLQTTLALAGQHNVKNAAAASACAVAAGVPLVAIALGLASFQPVAGRSVTKSFFLRGAGATLIDDSYNANPDSVRAAIEVLATMPAPRWLLLGDMGEVGQQGPAFHQEVGKYARAMHIDNLWTAGSLTAHCGADRHFPNVEDMVRAIELNETPPAVSVLVKGSRFMRMEKAVAALLHAA
eukprot:g72569.t1